MGSQSLIRPRRHLCGERRIESPLALGQPLIRLSIQLPTMDNTLKVLFFL